MNNTINQSSINFKANLYSTKGKLIKNTNFFDMLNAENNMATKGSPKTDIFVKKITSEKLGKGIYKAYKICADLVIKNPLLGSQAFSQVIDQNYASPCEDECDEMKHIDSLVGHSSNDCKSLEDKALYLKILEEIKANQKKAGFILEEFIPSKVLEKMLNKIPQEEHGFTEDRIIDFKRIASEMDKSILKNQNLDNFDKFI